MRKYSTPLAIKEMQIKTTLRFLLIPLRLANLKQSTASGCEDARKKELLHTVGEI
jgi:hypothetical protein